MGQFEAFMKIFPNMHMKDSNIKVEYIPLGKPEDISRYLVRANEDFVYPNKELFNVEGREGLYYVKPNIIEKYVRRGDNLKDICLAQFAKMYDSARSVKKSTENNDSESDEELTVKRSTTEQLEDDCVEQYHTSMENDECVEQYHTNVS